MNHRSLLVSAAVFLFTAVPTACSLPSPGPQVSLRGRVDAAMVQQVTAALQQGHRDFTIDSSHGGYVGSAMVMSAALSRHQASLTATGRCWSACALLLFGVERRRATAEADIRIHAAVYGDGRPGDAPAREAVRFMIKHGVPAALAEHRGTGINSYRLTPADLFSAGITAAGIADL